MSETVQRSSLVRTLGPSRPGYDFNYLHSPTRRTTRTCYRSSCCQPLWIWRHGGRPSTCGASCTTKQTVSAPRPRRSGGYASPTTCAFAHACVPGNFGDDKRKDVTRARRRCRTIVIGIIPDYLATQRGHACSLLAGTEAPGWDGTGMPAAQNRVAGWARWGVGTDSGCWVLVAWTGRFLRIPHGSPKQRRTALCRSCKGDREDMSTWSGQGLGRRKRLR